MKGIHLLFILYPDILALCYKTLKICNLPKSDIRKNRITTLRYRHSKLRNYVAPLEWSSGDKIYIFFLLVGHGFTLLDIFKMYLQRSSFGNSSIKVFLSPAGSSLFWFA
jgi:hypothetical protein